MLVCATNHGRCMIFKTPRSTLLRGLKAMLAMQGCNYIVHFCQAGDYIVRLFVWGDRSELWLFITSEVFFFLRFFWAYFHARLAHNVELGGLWPPLGVIILETTKVQNSQNAVPRLYLTIVGPPSELSPRNLKCNHLK